MKNRNIIRSLLLAVIIAGSFLVLWAASPAKQHTPCKESMEGCCKKEKDNNSNKMTWETLSHQFFSSL
ncbi:MAG TPA: hypothetical protein VIZ28_16000 [Chitinophagaceae bacterium]